MPTVYRGLYIGWLYNLSSKPGAPLRVKGGNTNYARTVQGITGCMSTLSPGPCACPPHSATRAFLPFHQNFLLVAAAGLRIHCSIHLEASSPWWSQINYLTLFRSWLKCYILRENSPDPLSKTATDFLLTLCPLLHIILFGLAKKFVRLFFSVRWL